jgi:1-acyl-sn-glycerol-3-phosphate acyltransferase
MARHNIEQPDFFYLALKNYVRIWFRLFYNRIEVIGYDENIPKNVPIILASNHQNALIDAWAVLFTIPDHAVYLARSDIFENPITNKILTFLKIMPIFRIRDGIKNLSRNQEIFEKTVDILHNNQKLAILPEGNHAGFRKLRVLKKGIARITFQSAEKSNFDLPIHIVPIGLEYGNYINSRSKLFINIGKPLEAAKYYDAYKENPQRTMNNMLKDLRERLSELMIDIKDDENYHLYEDVRVIYREEMKQKMGLDKSSQANNFKSDKEFIAQFEDVLKSDTDGIEEFKANVKQYNNNLKKLRIRDWVIEKKQNIPYVILQIIFGLILFPIHLYGLVFNYIPYKIPVWFTEMKIKDKMFYSSFRLALASLIFPVFYLIFYLVFGFTIGFNLYSLLFLISMPLTGMVTLKNYIFLKKRFAQIRFTLGKFFKKPLLLNTISLRNDIISFLNEKIKI